MSIISEALIKQRGGGSGEDAAAHPIGSIIRRGSPAGGDPLPAPIARGPARASAVRKWTWVWGPAALAAGAIAIGFLSNNANREPARRLVSAEPAIPYEAPPTRVGTPGSPPAPAIPAATPRPAAPTPLPTPIIVRVQFEALRMPIAPPSAPPPVATSPPVAAGDVPSPTSAEIQAPPGSAGSIMIASPTPQPAARERTIKEFKLDGIFYSQSDPAAVINDRIVEEGDNVDGLTVVKIHKTYVRVLLGGAEYDLR